MQDTMRDLCLNELAGIWYNLVVTYSDSNPDLAEAVLSAMRRYIAWIDIGLVANDRHASSMPISWPSVCIAHPECSGHASSLGPSCRHKGLKYPRINKISYVARMLIHMAG
jgi:hypothetical protein